MKSALIKIISFLFIAVTFSSCKEEAGKSDSTSSAPITNEQDVSSAKNDNNCTVTQLSNGARIDCGNTSATILNGAATSNIGQQGPIGPQGIQGVTGPQGPVGPRGPAGISVSGAIRLIDGDGTQIGDVVVSASSEDNSNPEHITIYDSTIDATVVYHFGAMNRHDTIFFSNADCSGTAYRLHGDISSDATPPQGNYIANIGGNAYRVSTQVSYAIPLAKLTGSGPNFACSANTQLYSRVYMIATHIPIPPFPFKLKPGYHVKFQ